MLHASEIIPLFDSEIRVLKKLIKLEESKRVAILGARGKELQKISQQQEVELEELANLGRKRDILLSHALPADELNLSAILDFFANHVPQDAEAIRKSVATFRQTAAQLQQSTVSNREILTETNTSVRRLLDSLKDGVNSDQNLTYQPGKLVRQNKGASLLLNANA